MLKKVYTFSAGPSTLDPLTLQEIYDELEKRQIIFEISPSSIQMRRFAQETRQMLRQLYSIPGDYSVILLKGGASFNFSCIPISFLESPKGVGNYLVTGTFSKKASDECKKFGVTRVVNEKWEDKSKPPVYSKTDV